MHPSHPLAKVFTAAIASAMLLPLQSNAQSDDENFIQETPLEATGNQWTGGGLEEITVTAKKRSTSLQDTPLSISAWSADQLQKVGATNNYDVALITPNFSTNQQLGRRLDRPVIRGQSGPSVGGEANASYFIDGVFVSGSISSATLGPVEQVEILRGPQSAQFGRATFAGAVNYITRKPTNEQEGEVRLLTATNDTLQLSGWTSGPIIEDTLTYFIAAGYDQYGGEWNNDLKANQATTGAFIDPPQYGDSSKLGGTETKDFVGKLLWNATETTEIGLKLGYTKARDDHYAQLILEPGELNCYLPTKGTNGTADNSNEVWYNTSQGAYCGEVDFNQVTYANGNPFAGPYIPGAPLNGGARQSRFNLPDFRNGMTLLNTSDPTLTAAPTRPGSDREQKRSLLTIDQGLGEWELSARVAYNKDEFRTAYDLDQRETRPIGGVFTTEQILEVKDKSLELIVSSPQNVPVRGSLGVYAFNSDQTNSSRRYVGYWGFAPGSGLGQFEQPLQKAIRNRSVFGTIDVDITSDLTLSLEARYAKDKKTIDSPYFCEDPASPYNGQQLNDATDNDALTPRITLSWQATDDIMVYALAAKGNKPAEFNDAYFRATVQDDPCATLEARAQGLTQTKEETAWTYEAGTKTTWLDGRALFNLSVFAIEWQNQTVFQTIDLGNIIATTQSNAGRSEVIGLELESSFAVTDNLIASMSYGLADGKYKRFNSDLIAFTTGEGLIPGTATLDPNANNAAGNSIPFSPKQSVVGSLAYTHQLKGAIDWFARTDAVWESKRYTGAANFLVLPARTIWNGRLGLESDDWAITGYVSNILNDETPQSAPSFLYFSGTPSNINWAKNCGGEPCRTGIETAAFAPSRGRQYGLDLLYKF